MSELTGTTYVRKDGAKEHNGPNWGDALAGTSKKCKHPRTAHEHGNHVHTCAQAATARQMRPNKGMWLIRE